MACHGTVHGTGGLFKDMTLFMACHGCSWKRHHTVHGHDGRALFNMNSDISH